MQYHEIGKTGMKVSSLSFGASSLGGVFHDVKEKEGIEAVFTAVESGMNFIDVSPYYGHYKAETVLGKALKDICGPLDRISFSRSALLGGDPLKGGVSAQRQCRCEQKRQCFSTHGFVPLSGEIRLFLPLRGPLEHIAYKIRVKRGDVCTRRPVCAFWLLKTSGRFAMRLRAA